MTEPSQAGCKSVVTKFQQCPLLNISYCSIIFPSEVRLSKGKDLVVSEHVTVKDSAGKEIESQILPLLNESLSIRNNLVKAYLGISPSETSSYWLAFSATVPPLGFSTYIISSSKHTGYLAIAATTSERLTLHKTEPSQNDEIKVGPGNLKLIYSGNDGKLIEYTNSKSSVKKSL
uniref:alpha-mannosidase-like n=1 Tax=Fragaria vesca subsp. vesca TaxID=101020 RepID=UPI0005CA5C11|nr:PREDICTED: alpha-mannosidase-like [Fragaria vesca subsp. vesca]